MIKELYQVEVNQISLNITQSKIDSVRKKNIVKSGCRVYDNGFIGIAGTFGEPTEETWKDAIKNLELKVPYEFQPEKNKRRERNACPKPLSDEEVIGNTEKILEVLRKEYPDFIFSNKVNYNVNKEILKNDSGLEYINIDGYVSFMVIFKTVDSVNIMDGAVLFVGREYSVEKVLDNARNQLKGYRNVVELPTNKNMMVAVPVEAIGGKLIESLNGEMLGRKVSMFTDKVGEKVFSDDFSVMVDLSEELYGTAFFDGEGSTLENDRKYLIENGKILCGYTDKKKSKEFGVPNTAAAGGAYDDVPSLSGVGYGIFSVKKSNKTIAELTNNEEYIYIDTASGGDWTNEGGFASPVQVGYLMKGTQVIGRLPEFAISGNLYEMFGKDYIGYSKDKNYTGNNVIVTKMKIEPMQ